MFYKGEFLKSFVDYNITICKEVKSLARIYFGERKEGIMLI